MPQSLIWNSGLAWNTPGVLWSGTVANPTTTPMSDANKISQIITAQERTTVLAAFVTIKTALPWLRNLTPAQSRAMPTLGTERGGMDETFAMEMAAHPEFVPGFTDMAELEKDRELWLGLSEFLACAKELHDSLQDTQQIAGSDIYGAYLAFYQNVRQAAKRAITGAETVYQNLRRFFPGGSAPTPPAPPTP